jgi:hypothetical protein
MGVGERIAGQIAMADEPLMKSFISDRELKITYAIFLWTLMTVRCRG